MNCDRIAPFYKWFEKAAFGERLQRHRVTFSWAASDKKRVLVLGDGDGRFVEALITQYPHLEIDCVEISAGMVSETRKRAGDKVRVIQGDAFYFPFPPRYYDIAFTHFFLDCFNANQLANLVPLISAALDGSAVWIVSDFRHAVSGWRRLYTGLWLKTMYLFFRFATGLETRHLPEYDQALEAAGFHRPKQHVSMLGLIASEWWER